MVLIEKRITMLNVGNTIPCAGVRGAIKRKNSYVRKTNLPSEFFLSSFWLLTKCETTNGTETIKYHQERKIAGMTAHTFNLTPQEQEANNLCEFKVILFYIVRPCTMRPCLKAKQTKPNQWVPFSKIKVDRIWGLILEVDFWPPQECVDTCVLTHTKIHKKCLYLEPS